MVKTLLIILGCTVLALALSFTVGCLYGWSVARWVWAGCIAAALIPLCALAVYRLIARRG